MGHRVTQAAAEAVRSPVPAARATQAVAEAVRAPTPKARSSQLAIDVVKSVVYGSIVSQLIAEAVYSTGSHYWSIVDGVVRLTLTGSGSGQVSVSRTFTGLTPNQLLTFYLTVDPSVVAVGAFFEVEGGDTTVATIAGSQVLRARGTTDGSGNITLRFGAQHIENAPTSETSDSLGYADQAAAEAASWSVTNTTPSGVIGFNSGHALGGHPTSIRFAAGSSGGLQEIEHTYTVLPGQTYNVRVWAESEYGVGWWNTATLDATSGANSGHDGINGGESAQQLTATVVAADTTLTVAIQVPSGFVSASTFYFAGLEVEGTGGVTSIRFSPLSHCTDSGLVIQEAA